MCPRPTGDTDADSQMCSRGTRGAMETSPVSGGGKFCCNDGGH